MEEEFLLKRNIRWIYYILAIILVQGICGFVFYNSEKTIEKSLADRKMNTLKVDPVTSCTIKVDELIIKDKIDTIKYSKRNLSNISGKKGERLFHEIVLKAAKEYEVDPALVKAIIFAESSYNPLAVSKKGAKGLMQLMPRTAAFLGVKDTFNPENNIFGGVKYFKQLVTTFNGDIKLALAAYNAGRRIVKKYNGIPPYKATKAYVAKVLKYYESYKREMEKV